MSSCAPCHGADGKGKGPLSANKLKTKPADLTALAKKNNGVFPVSAVYEAIDGRNAIESHGAREMPIWGCRHTPSPVSPLKHRNVKYTGRLTLLSHISTSLAIQKTLSETVYCLLLNICVAFRRSSRDIRCAATSNCRQRGRVPPHINRHFDEQLKSRSALNQSIQMILGVNASSDEICQTALARLVLALAQSAAK
ncbi:MAG: hypothetical protein WBL43_09525 [Pseudolabrys sp.]